MFLLSAFGWRSTFNSLPGVACCALAFFATHSGGALMFIAALVAWSLVVLVYQCFLLPGTTLLVASPADVFTRTQACRFGWTFSMQPILWGGLPCKMPHFRQARADSLIICAAEGKPGSACGSQSFWREDCILSRQTRLVVVDSGPRMWNRRLHLPASWRSSELLRDLARIWIWILPLCGCSMIAAPDSSHCFWCWGLGRGNTPWTNKATARRRRASKGLNKRNRTVQTVP